MKRFFFRHVFEPPLEKVREWAWVLLASFSILVISSIPIWVGYLTQPPGRVFIGTFYDQQDYAVHLTMMQAGMQGDWAYFLHFTAEPHRAVYIRLFYIALGHLTRLLHLEPEMAFQLARWVFGLLALAAVYQLASRIFPEVKWRRTAFLLATTGAGFGWQLWKADLDTGNPTEANILFLGTYAATCSISWHSNIHMALPLLIPGILLWAEGKLPSTIACLWLFLPTSLFLTLALVLDPGVAHDIAGIAMLGVNTVVLLWTSKQSYL